MQQFVVPQFIDVEDKIIGFVTVRQFLILLSGGLIVFIAYRLADFTLFVLIAVLVGGLALIFAFAKYNGQNFHYILLYIIQFLFRPSERRWRKDYSNRDLDILRNSEPSEKEIIPEKAPAVERRRISDLSLIVNTGGYYKGDWE
jgi:hypothetical protein